MKLKAPKHDSLWYVVGVVMVIMSRNPVLILASGLLVGHFLRFMTVFVIIIVMGIGYVL